MARPVYRCQALDSWLISICYKDILIEGYSNRKIKRIAEVPIKAKKTVSSSIGMTSAFRLEPGVTADGGTIRP
ncbi:MAG: hypothetical protein CNF00_00670 [Candidatus Thioglobus sp. MED-G25]|nr:MAG: hypothetical protein CNF00_00670 [Candidatus Thioglobus sp. MED-G25]